MGVTGKEFAAQRGVDPSRVSQWKRQGRLVMDADGKIDAAASNAALDASLDRSKGERSDGRNHTSAAPAASAPQGTPPVAPAADASPGQPTEPGAGDRSGYWASKARREKAEAELAELRALQAAGALTSVAGVKKEAAETARAMRNAFLAIPDRISPVLDPGNPARARKLLTDELEKVLREFSAELEQRAAVAAGADQPELALQ